MTTLARSVSATETALIVDAALTSSAPYPIALTIESEKLLVNGGNGTRTLFVSRGQDGTTAATHAAGTTVTAGWSAGGGGVTVTGTSGSVAVATEYLAPGPVTEASPGVAQQRFIFVEHADLNDDVILVTDGDDNVVADLLGSGKLVLSPVLNSQIPLSVRAPSGASNEVAEFKVGNNAVVIIGGNDNMEVPALITRALDNATPAFVAGGVSTVATTGTIAAFGDYLADNSAGTAKLGFFGSTAVTQPVAIANATDAGSTLARLNDLLAAMRALGLIDT